MSGANRINDERAFRAAEALLAHLHPKEDTIALMRTLREHFASADALFRADVHMLEELGVQKGDALLLNRLPELSRLMRRVRLEKFPQLGRLRDATEYLVASFRGLQVERFYMFCLDARGRLKEPVLLSEGTSDSALFNQRRMLSEALRLQADAVILSHNHPGLTLEPSHADVVITERAIRALTSLGIPLLDHVIIAEEIAISLRLNGYLTAEQWLGQCPEHALLRGWLEGAKITEIR